MIISYNVCEHCGTQTEIMSGSGGIEVQFVVEPVVVSRINLFGRATIRGTFCDKECYILWLQENLNEKGYLKPEIYQKIYGESGGK